MSFRLKRGVIGCMVDHDNICQETWASLSHHHDWPWPRAGVHERFCSLCKPNFHPRNQYNDIDVTGTVEMQHSWKLTLTANVSTTLHASTVQHYRIPAVQEVHNEPIDFKTICVFPLYFQNSTLPTSTVMKYLWKRAPPVSIPDSSASPAIVFAGSKNPETGAAIMPSFYLLT